ncbi:hypothetical protein GCM10011329_09470 [Stakelama pacifica]|nr:hypothetical protein GCM10011329_09470 [Stakelama pacifica]
MLTQMVGPGGASRPGAAATGAPQGRAFQIRPCPWVALAMMSIAVSANDIAPMAKERSMVMFP